MTILGNTESRNGFTFEGWSETENGDVKYKPGDTFKITGNVNLYPVWKKIPEYTITYHLNNGTISQKSVYKGEATTVNVSDSRTGYEFQGWTTMKEEAVVYKIGDKVEITENMDFYPVWTVDPVDDVPAGPIEPPEPANPSKPSEKGDESEEPTIPSEPSGTVNPPKPSDKDDSPEGPADPSEPSEPATPSEPSQKDEPATDDKTNTSDTDASSDSDGGSGLGLASVAAIAGVTVAVAALMVMIFRRT